MKSIKGTETEKNLLKSFAGESQARNRYTFFASQAKKEGYMQISDIFTETANQEKEHAERFFKFLEGGDLEITASFPAGVIGDTRANLIEAAAGEHDECTTCIRRLPPRPARRASRRSRMYGSMWSSPKSSMSTVIWACLRTSKTARFSRRTIRSSGAAATAATSTRGPKRRKPARPAPTRAPISRFLPKTGKFCLPERWTKPLSGWPESGFFISDSCLEWNGSDRPEHGLFRQAIADFSAASIDWSIKHELIWDPGLYGRHGFRRSARLIAGLPFYGSSHPAAIAKKRMNSIPGLVLGNQWDIVIQRFCVPKKIFCCWCYTAFLFLTRWLHENFC